jgi:two-component system, LytTR family, response regulator LytT
MMYWNATPTSRTPSLFRNMSKEPIRVLIVEDEPIIGRDIAQRLRSKGHEVVGFARSRADAVEQAHELRPNVVIMDIHLLDGHSGVEAAKQIREELDLPVIFLTANSDNDTLSKAKIAEPYGFVVKPFTDQALHTAIEIALSKFNGEQQIRSELERLYDLVEESANADHFFVKAKGKLVRLRFSEIAFVEALKDYVGIHVAGQRYVVHATLQDMEDRLPAKQFMRVHRSYIVRLDKIHAVEEGEITMERTERKVPIGGSFLGKVRERLDPL